LPPTISLQEGNAYVNEIRKMIRSFPEVGIGWCHSMAVRMTGTDAAGFFSMRNSLRPLKPVSEMGPILMISKN